MTVRRLPITEMLIGKENDEVRELQELIDLATENIRANPQGYELSLYDCGVEGKIAGFLLYDGVKGYEEKATVVLLPDLGLITCQQSYSHKHHTVSWDPNFLLLTAQSVVTSLFSQYVDDAVPEGILESLRAAASVSV